MRRQRRPAPDPYDGEEYGAPSHRPPTAPTERGGLRVGDRVTLVAHHGSRWPVEVTGFTILPDDVVVRWLGLRPLGALTASGQSTISRAHLAGIEAPDTAPTPTTGRTP